MITTHGPRVLDHPSTARSSPARQWTATELVCISHTRECQADITTPTPADTTMVKDLT
jgi:hypothetical protein